MAYAETHLALVDGATLQLARMNIIDVEYKIYSIDF